MAVNSFRDLKVYQKAFELHLTINDLTMTFPKFEMYELGSQMRRSSNSVPANIAEGWNNKHLNIVLETLNRAVGESRETRHHLSVALAKKYITDEKFTFLDTQYEEVIKMLYGLRNALTKDNRE